ncbi:MAG: lipoprotein [Gammaproteobacteria bacterium]|nr:lipoprotein [Gammaproteobacteria bacterium]MDH3465175.1 lipoprotein [Gammaproteobacteria bacterium]
MQCWTFAIRHFAGWLIVASILLVGCGQKGPLYLPADTEQEQTEEESTSTE